MTCHLLADNTPLFILSLCRCVSTPQLRVLSEYLRFLTLTYWQKKPQGHIETCEIYDKEHKRINRSYNAEYYLKTDVNTPS